VSGRQPLSRRFSAILIGALASKVLGCAMIPMLVILVLGFVIQSQLEGLLQWLFAGGIADLACLALAVALLTPAIVNGLFRQLRRSFRLRGELG
jgi:hypothetical protein